MLGLLADMLSLALPVRPLAPGAEMPEGAAEADDSGDGDDRRRPFAGLADLKNKLQKDDGKD